MIIVRRRLSPLLLCIGLFRADDVRAQPRTQTQYSSIQSSPVPPGPPLHSRNVDSFPIMPYAYFLCVLIVPESKFSDRADHAFGLGQHSDHRERRTTARSIIVLLYILDDHECSLRLSLLVSGFAFTYIWHAFWKSQMARGCTYELQEGSLTLTGRISITVTWDVHWPGNRCEMRNKKGIRIRLTGRVKRNLQYQLTSQIAHKGCISLWKNEIGGKILLVKIEYVIFYYSKPYSWEERLQINKEDRIESLKECRIFPSSFFITFSFWEDKKRRKEKRRRRRRFIHPRLNHKAIECKMIFALFPLSLYLTVQYPVFSAGSLPKEYSIISLSLPLCVFAVIAHFFFCFKYLCLIFRWLGHSRVRVFLTSVSLESQCLQTSTVWERKKRRKRKSVQYKLCSHQTHCRPRLMLCILYVSDPDSGDPFPISLSHYSASNPSRERCR